MADARRSDDPHDRLTRIGDRLADALRGDPEYVAGDRAVIMLTNDAAGDGGTALFGYDRDADAMADMVRHLKAVGEANGKTFKILPLGRV